MGYYSALTSHGHERGCLVPSHYFRARPTHCTAAEPSCRWASETDQTGGHMLTSHAQRPRRDACGPCPCHAQPAQPTQRRSRSSFALASAWFVLQYKCLIIWTGASNRPPRPTAWCRLGQTVVPP
jgi:hypothetical protein